MKAFLTLAAALSLGIEMADSKPHELKKKKASATALELGRNFAKISRAPLKRQNSSDAWNERDNKLVAGRSAAKLLIKSAKLRGQNK
jgi:hypothetical protein